jgi:hypothetical protein
MTLYLKPVDVVSEVAKFRSALIVVCRFCPATSLSLQTGQPYMEFFRRFLNTKSYEEYIEDLRQRLEADGVSTGVFRGNLLNFIICMWTDNQRRKLLERARGYEAAVVLGCDVAFDTVSEILESTECQVFHGMKCEGVLDARPRFHFPGTISLEMVRVTPYAQGFPPRV